VRCDQRGELQSHAILYKSKTGAGDWSAEKSLNSIAAAVLRLGYVGLECAFMSIRDPKGFDLPNQKQRLSWKELLLLLRNAMMRPLGWIHLGLSSVRNQTDSTRRE